MKNYDVIIIGGGPGGSVLGALLANQGKKVAIIERERFPRFHIGESLLPASMPIYKETGFYETLASGKYIDKFGARFFDYRSDDEVYFGFAEGLNREIPNAFEVERSEFDRDILDHAVKCGVDLYQPERVKTVDFFADHVKVTTNNQEMTAKFIADCTGRESLLGKQFSVRTRHEDLNNVAVFAHFTGVKRNPGRHEGDIAIALLPQQAWAWIIPFKGERTSVGIVCNAKAYKGGVDLWEYMQENFASSSVFTDYMKNADRVSEIQIISNYSHHCDHFSGDRWILVGDAAAFLDPIFSSGVHVASQTAKLASNVLLEALNTNTLITTDDRGKKYQADFQKGVDRFHNLISLFYGNNFVEQMKKTLTRENMRQGFTSAVAGDMWNDNNFLFEKSVL